VTAAVQKRSGAVPTSDLDPFDDSVLLDPYPSYRRLRDVGPVVWMRRYDMWALPRYAEVSRALRDWQAFSSASGVGMTREYNERSGGILGSDPPEHDRLRDVIQGQLSPPALREIEDELQARADALVDGLTARGSFDAVRDLAQPYTVSVVADLVGLPEEGRSELLGNSVAGFNRFGPRNQRYVAAEPGFERLLDYVTTVAVPGRLTPGGKGDQLYKAAEAGALHPGECPRMMLAYTWPSLDTSVSAIANAVRQFALHPDQWDLVRDDPSLIAAAFNEALRLDPPVQLFTRVTTRDVDLGDVTLPAGARLMVMMGSANRDERHYPNPDRFDVRRNPTDHLAFGRGIHYCVGAALARLEGHAVIRALTRRVSRITLHHSRQRLHNIVRGPEELHVRTETETTRPPITPAMHERHLDLARRLAAHGPVPYEHELADFIAHARRLGAKPLLLSILADTREPDVVRERAFGRILAWLTDPGP
jgi:cytochrome P450